MDETPDETPLDYGRMIAEALRDVARQALRQVAEEGLPGEHHLFLTFHTRAEGVRVPPYLRDQYPDEMTVVLQNQYWDLEVDAEAFGVTLAFGGQHHHVVVPFAALTAFADPAAQLGLRFEPVAEGEEGAEEGAEESDAGAGGAFASGASAARDEAAAPASSGGGADVVQFDRFRKRDRD